LPSVADIVSCVYYYSTMGQVIANIGGYSKSSKLDVLACKTCSASTDQTRGGADFSL